MNNNNWQTKKLGDVFDIKPSKDDIRKRLKSIDLVSFVPMEDLGILKKEFTINKERRLEDVIDRYTYFANEDLLLAKITPCFENGKIGIARNLKNGAGFGSSEYIVFRSTEEVIPDYLFYFLCSDHFRNEGKNRMSGAVGHKRVAKDFVKNFEIKYPEAIKEQKRIVKKLDDIFEKIEKAKENTEDNLQSSRDLFESYLNIIFTNVDNKWEEKSLERIGKITSSKRIYKREYVKQGIPFYRIKEIKELTNGRNISIELYISEERYLEIKKVFGVPIEGDILMTAVGTIGEIYVVKKDEKFYFKDGNVLWFKDFDSIDPYFLRFALISFVEKIKKLSMGAAYSALTIEKIEKYRIGIPSLSQQREIVKKLDNLSEQTKKLEEIYKQKLAGLEELKKSVLSEAFSGKL